MVNCHRKLLFLLSVLPCHFLQMMDYTIILHCYLGSNRIEFKVALSFYALGYQGLATWILWNQLNCQRPTISNSLVQPIIILFSVNKDIKLHKTYWKSSGSELDTTTRLTKTARDSTCNKHFMFATVMGKSYLWYTYTYSLYSKHDFPIILGKCEHYGFLKLPDLG